MSEKGKTIRVPFNINRGNPEHEKVYAILEKQKNKNAFIREAILSYYAQGILCETPLTKEDVSEVLADTNAALVETILCRLEEELFLQRVEQSAKEEKDEIDFDNLKNLF